MVCAEAAAAAANSQRRRRARPKPALLLPLLLLLGGAAAAHAARSGTLDALPGVQRHAPQLSDDDLAASLRLSVGILQQHNVHLESQPLARLAGLLQDVLARDCCDFFAALPLLKGLRGALAEVAADERLPSSARPVLRRAFVAAVWRLQRSKQFAWDSAALRSEAQAGFLRLYEQHIDAASGRPVSFHHISKTGGTSLCGTAWENGCRGPGMSQRDNCLLDPGLDGPLWVMRHDVLAANRLTAMHGPSSTSPNAPEQQQQQPPAHAFDWFMYDCPQQRLQARVARSCSERQEAALSRAATFFAAENVLPVAHGASPEVCGAFLNVVVVRDAVSQAVSLMAEASLVYARLLKQHRVLGWAPPKWTLAWWQRMAPVVVSSYATRTLLGPAAYCPANASAAASASPAAGAAAEEPLQARTGTWAVAGAAADSSNGRAGPPRALLSAAAGDGTSSPLLPPVQAEQLQAALHLLASFDVVLELGRPELMDASLAHLLGWSGPRFSDARRRRPAPHPDAPSWHQLELLARQQLPGATAHVAAGSSEGAGQQLSGAAGAAPAAERDDATTDLVRCMLAEAAVRQAHARHGVAGTLLPVAAGMHLPRLPPAAVADALAALQAVNGSRLVVRSLIPSSSSSSGALDSTAALDEHLLVEVSAPRAPHHHVFQAAAAAAPGLIAAAAANASVAAGASASQQQQVYHVWPRHGVLLAEAAYAELLEATAADAALHRHARVMQLLDAAWVGSLVRQRRVRRMLARVREDEEDAQAACGFAGLNHLQ